MWEVDLFSFFYIDSQLSHYHYFPPWWMMATHIFNLHVWVVLFLDSLFNFLGLFVPKNITISTALLLEILTKTCTLFCKIVLSILSPLFWSSPTLLKEKKKLLEWILSEITLIQVNFKRNYVFINTVFLIINLEFLSLFEFIKYFNSILLFSPWWNYS
jgi:hypothetical protein